MSGPRSEQGESLLEVLIAVAIMGIAVVAIMAGLTTSILMSDIHRKQATAGEYARDYAEAIQSALTSSSCTSPTPAAGCYRLCAAGSWYENPSGFSVPAGYGKSVVAGTSRYWNGTAWQSACSTDAGLQQLTVQVASADGRASERVVVVLRRPCRMEDSLCG
ncbi:prepilin-type N-terminal cleavage/methylation domain-containing protein [Kribbella sp. NPDC059898]|uniref:type IV pilus modification PilV family protein n=1 Tax=Kribbella sp. NPDC059898 TaxID=3346995 RepID=UPI00365A414E